MVTSVAAKAHYTTITCSSVVQLRQTTSDAIQLASCLRMPYEHMSKLRWMSIFSGPDERTTVNSKPSVADRQQHERREVMIRYRVTAFGTFRTHLEDSIEGW